MIAELVNWWSEGLAMAWLAGERALRPPRRFRLSASALPLALLSADARLPIAAFAVDDHGDVVKPLPEVLRQTHRSRIEIVIPSAAILEQQLDPLPAESRPYVDSVVRHRIDTMFPWSAADILYVTAITDRQDGRIDVAVRATSRSAVAPALAAAAICSPDEVVLIAEGGDERTVAAIPVLAGSEAPAKSGRARLIARYAIAALMVSAFGVMAWSTFARWSLASDVAALDQAIADRRAVLARTMDLRGADGAGGLDARKQKAPIAVVVLEQLSNVLPDDTYISDLALEAGRVRIAGVSAHTAELVALLEGSGHFRNAVFYAPTTRLPGGTTDRFSIEAAVVPQEQVRP